MLEMLRKQARNAAGESCIIDRDQSWMPEFAGKFLTRLAKTPAGGAIFCVGCSHTISGSTFTSNTEAAIACGGDCMPTARR